MSEVTKLYREWFYYRSTILFGLHRVFPPFLYNYTRKTLCITFLKHKLLTSTEITQVLILLTNLQVLTYLNHHLKFVFLVVLYLSLYQHIHISPHCLLYGAYRYQVLCMVYQLICLLVLLNTHCAVFCQII